MNRRIDNVINFIVLLFTAVFAIYAYRYLGYFSNTSEIISLPYATVVAFGAGVLLRYTLIAYTNLSPFRRLLDPSSYFEGVWYGSIIFNDIKEDFVATIRFNQKTKSYELFGQGFDSKGNESSEFRSSIFEYVKSQDRAIFALDYLKRKNSASSGYLFGILSFSFWSKATPDHARGNVYDSVNSISGQIQLSRVALQDIYKATGSYVVRSPEDAEKLISSKSKKTEVQQ
ncbi:MAG: hypothetical protein H6976_16620 [Gammaproteobacteria bacterium]|nr:hypothetical protein [Gammaproteobacteria bacterium]